MSVNKFLAMYDGCEPNEKCRLGAFKDTDIIVKNHDTDEVIFRTKNKVIIPGSETIARKLFDISADPVTPNYNTALGLVTPTAELTEQPVVDTNTTATESDNKVLLFCVGVDGCGDSTSQVYTVDYRKWLAPEDMIPFRYQLTSNDLSDTLRASYFGRIAGAEYISYYFKRFEDTPTEVKQFVDGTAIDSTIYDTTREDEAETYIELQLQITKEDVRDYFTATSGIDEALVNTVQLCTAYPVTVDGYIYFENIRPITKLNFPNESLSDITKGIDIIYHIYL